MASFDRKTMLLIIEELNEKRQAGIKNATKLTNARMVSAILAATDNGRDLKKLSKQARGVIESMAATDELEETPESEQEPANVPASDEGMEQTEVQSDELEETPESEQEPADLTSREAMNLAALDMNDVMGLEPGIDINMDDVMFMKAFVKASEMATGTDNFKDFTWRVLEANDLGPERVLAKPIDRATLQQQLKKPKPVEKTKPAKKPMKKSSAGLGVIGTIRKFVADKAASEDSTFTLAQILDHLKATFPDKSEDGMMATVRTQVPGRVRKELGYSFEKIEPSKFKVSAPAE